MTLIHMFLFLMHEVARRAAALHGETIDLEEGVADEVAAAAAGLPSSSRPGPTPRPSTAPLQEAAPPADEPPAKRARPTAAKSRSPIPRAPLVTKAAAVAAARAAAKGHTPPPVPKAEVPMFVQASLN